MATADDRNKFAPLAAAGVAAGAVGYGVHRWGKGKEAELKDAKKKLATVRDAKQRDELIIQNEKLDTQSGFATSIGFSGMSFGIALALMAALVGGGVRLRRAAFALAPALLVAGVYAAYQAGVASVAVTSLAAVALTGYLTMGENPKAAREVAAFRRFPLRQTEPPKGVRGYRSAFVASKGKPEVLLAEVPRLPPSFERVLPTIGEGKPHSYLLLKRGLAYVAFVESDAYNLSDYATVLMLLEDPAPRFVVRPVPVLDGKPSVNTGIRFKDDKTFSDAFMVELARPQDRADVMAFVSDVVRDELLTLPSVWLHVEGNVMALTLYGDFDAGAVDRLVDVADVLFAELGADGGPSLLEPDLSEQADPPKKKKKKKKPTASGAALPST